MKYFIILYFLVTICSCKKKTQDPEVLPDTVINPTYESYFGSNLNIDIKNGANDTILSFSGNVLKTLNGVQTSEIFKSITYNNSMVQFDNNPNFLRLAGNSNWSFTYQPIGAFTYTNNTPAPLIGNADSLSFSTISGQGINLDLHNLTNVDQVTVSFKCDCWPPLSGAAQGFPVNGGSNISGTVSYILDELPLNQSLLLVLSAEKTDQQTINGNKVYATKTTEYTYRTKRVN